MGHTAIFAKKFNVVEKVTIYLVNSGMTISKIFVTPLQLESEIVDDIDGTKCESLNLPIAEDEIRAAIRALQNQNAAGPDGGRFCPFWWIFLIICLIVGCFQMNGLYRLHILCTKKELSVYQTINYRVHRFLIYLASCII